VNYVDFSEGAAARAAEACEGAADALLWSVVAASEQLAATDWAGGAQADAARALTGLAVLARSEAASLRRSADALREAIVVARRLSEHRAADAAAASAARRRAGDARLTQARSIHGCVEISAGPSVSGRPGAPVSFVSSGAAELSVSPAARPVRVR
jgi:hypothetical protein